MNTNLREINAVAAALFAAVYAVLAIIANRALTDMFVSEVIGRETVTTMDFTVGMCWFVGLSAVGAIYALYDLEQRDLAYAERSALRCAKI